MWLVSVLNALNKAQFRFGCTNQIFILLACVQIGTAQIQLCIMLAFEHYNIWATIYDLQ